jgi:hypothetical protein
MRGGLTEDEVRSYIADNQLAAKASWDRCMTAIELHHLDSLALDFYVSVKGPGSLGTLRSIPGLIPPHESRLLSQFQRQRGHRRGGCLGRRVTHHEFRLNGNVRRPVCVFLDPVQ